MRITWAQQLYKFNSDGDGIFLAGPTLRKSSRNCESCAGWGFFDYPLGRDQCLHCGGRGYFSLVSWRLQAIREFEKIGYLGELYVPEPEGCGSFSSSELDHSAQIKWSRRGLSRSRVIMFWVPRDLDTLPGFTTNIEFGEWCRSGKCVLGYPSTAKKMGYLAYVAEEMGIPVAHTLEETVRLARERHDKTDHHRA